MNLGSFFKSQSKPSLIPLVKASLLLCYAHWEGGVKEISIIYLRHVEQQKKLRSELSTNFLALESISSIKQAALSSEILLYKQVVDHTRFNLPHRYRLPNINLIDTESNLSSKVINNILCCIGLDSEVDYFIEKKRVIDTQILKTRNDVAHTGQTENREDIDIIVIIDEILELLNRFQTIVENAAATKSYLQR